MDLPASDEAVVRGTDAADDHDDAGALSLLLVAAMNRAQAVMNQARSSTRNVHVGHALQVTRNHGFAAGALVMNSFATFSSSSVSSDLTVCAQLLPRDSERLAEIAEAARERANDSSARPTVTQR